MRKISPRRVMYALAEMSIGLIIALGIGMTAIALLFAVMEVMA